VKSGSIVAGENLSLHAGGGALASAFVHILVKSACD